MVDKRWRDDDVAVVRRLAARGFTTEQIAETLGRSGQSIGNICANRNISGPNLRAQHWTPPATDQAPRRSRSMEHLVARHGEALVAEMLTIPQGRGQYRALMKAALRHGLTETRARQIWHAVCREGA